MALPCNPAQMLQLAADTGCAAAGVRLLPTAPGGVAYRLMDDPALLGFPTLSLSVSLFTLLIATAAFRLAKFVADRRNPAREA